MDSGLTEQRLIQILNSFGDNLLHGLGNTLGQGNRATNNSSQSNYYNNSSSFFRSMQSSIKNMEKALELFGNKNQIDRKYGDSVINSISNIVSGYNKFMRNGKVDFNDSNGNFDPARFVAYNKSYNKSPAELARLESEKEDLEKIIQAGPDKIKQAKADYATWLKQNENVEKDQKAFLDNINNKSLPASEQFKTYMERLTIDGPASAQGYLKHLTKSTREEVLKLKEIHDGFEQTIAEGKKLESEPEAIENSVKEAEKKLDENNIDFAREKHRSILDAYEKDDESVFAGFKHSRNLNSIAKADNKLAWQVLQKNFQFGNNSLSSNFSKGFGVVLEKKLPQIISSFSGKFAAKFGGPIIAILTTIAGLIKRGIDTWLEMEEKTLEITKAMGMGAHDAHGYQQAIMWATAKYAAQYGLDKDSLLKIQSDVNESTGRNMIMNEEQLIDAVAGKKFMGDQTYAAMMKSFEMAGGSPDSAMKYGLMTMERAAKMGLNMQKASAEFAKNMGMVNKYSFKSGVDGISKMTLLSQQLKFNLESLTGLFDKVSTVEGSIDVAAQMQMLGGTYATQFGNPMRLLYNSLNNVEELTQTVIDTVVSKARFNERTGTVDINNLDRAFIKEMAKQTNVSQEDLFNMASRQVYLQQVRRQMSSDLSEAQRAQLGNMAQYSQTQGWIVSYLDANNELVTKQISEIRAEDMDMINKGRMFESVEDNVENIWLLLKEKYRDEAVAATSLKAKKAGLDIAYDMGLGRAVSSPMGGVSHGVNWVGKKVNDAFFYKDGTVHPLASDDNVYAFKGTGQVDTGAGKFYNSSSSSVRMAEQMTQTFIKGSSNTMASAISNSMRSMNSDTSSSIKYRETDNVYSSIESSVAKAVTNTMKAGALKTDVSVNGTINLRFPDGSSVDMIKQLQKPEVVRMLSSIIAQQLARLDNKGATPALGSNILKGTSI